jgi:toxin ParE1/3/4
MIPVIQKKSRVLDDLIEHSTNIAKDKIEPAIRFLDVAEDCFARLGSMPGMGTLVKSKKPHLKGIRSYPMPSGFRNYVIFYRPIENGIEVLTILHGARDLQRALERLSDIG